MISNAYYECVKHFERKIVEYANNIFKTYGKELVLRLEEYNLLQNKHNCIESSTAIGFVLEEFIVSKLEMYTHCDESSEYVIDRYVGGTTSESYDFYCLSGNIRFMVNVKAEKEDSANNAVAAIGQLYRNYCEENPEQLKSYIMFKILYSIGEGNEDTVERRAKPRNIHIDGIETYALEEIDFSKGHSQDHRRWSENTTSKNNWPLLISPKFRNENRVPDQDVSYSRTFKMIEGIYEGII